MTIAELIAGLSIELVRGSGSTVIREIVEDSRCAGPGCLFVARAGAKVDGCAFIADAIAGGAVAVLCNDAGAVPDGAAVVVADDVATAVGRLAERFHGHPGKALRLIGITGTNGKTTTAHLIHQILNQAGVRCGLVGTVQIDDGAAVTPASLTTPPAIETSRILRRMVDSGCAAAALEVSSHALQQRRTAGLSFHAAVFTNLSGDHLDYHGTMDAYAQAKAGLFESLVAESCAIVNIDDPAADRMLRDCVGRTLRCSLTDPTADCFAEVGRQTIANVEVVLTGPWGVFEVCLGLIGRHNVANALHAAAVCWVFGVERAALQSGLSCCTPPPGRLEAVTGRGNDFTVLVDYAHTDDALANVLHALRPLVPIGGRLRLVFGCGGDRDRTKRPRMARTAARFADELIITSDNPRTEDPQAIIDDILEGIPAQRLAETITLVDRRHAIEHAIQRTQPGDVLLIAGKGHEPYQIIGTQKRPFDDRLVAADALTNHRAKAVT